MLWTEVWPLLIPLIVVLLYPQINRKLRIVIFYIVVSLFLNLISTIISNYNDLVPQQFTNNNILYNISAFLKVILLGSYFTGLKQLKQYKYPRVLIYLFILLAVTNFLFAESIFNFSRYLFAGASILLLILCMTFLLNSIIDDDVAASISEPSFIICVAISIFETLNFFVYLFLFEIITTDLKIALVTMDISSYSYIISYSLLAVAIYKNSTKKLRFLTTNNTFTPDEK